MTGNILPTPPKATHLANGVAIHRGVRPAGDGSGRHTHDFHSITVLLSSPGSTIWCYGEDKCRSIRPAAGDVFFCPAHTTMKVRSEKSFESILLCLSPGLVDVDLGEAAPAIMRRDSFVANVVMSLADEAGRGQSGSELFASSLASALGVHLSREYTRRNKPIKPTARLSDDELAVLNRHIDQNLAAPIPLEVLASLVGRSRFHFSRLFQATTGTTPHQYVIRRRVERAEQLLRAGHSIVEVAVEVGFASQSHLNSHIQRAFGCTPGQLVGRSTD